ncbi:cholecystokinin receptor type A-like [Saccostrea echinata]|uniref:cholecystokinin receptor type A-like n=1 Tax=Saccostrea echinata TaxID=191078 RepID=UPI002A7ED7E7|nr:cholecystokinin receptor type A-like [Saccostrea echinata]
MENDTDYQLMLLEKYSDISLSSSVLIVIGAVIGIIGNLTIIVFYFFRIKERGERYFIPLLAIVDLVACFTSPPFYIMDNTFFYNYPSDTACRILSFLQMCVPGASAHILLVISIQRYLLVCKPFGPKMTLLWKKVFFGMACGFAVAYSVPLLGTSGVLKTVDKFMNHNVTTEICKFSVDNSPVITVYFGLLALIMLANIAITAGLYVPVLRQVKLSFRRKLKMTSTQNEINFHSHTESSHTTQSTEIELEKENYGKDCTELQEVHPSTKENKSNTHEHVRKTSKEKSNENTKEEIKVQNHEGAVESKHARPKEGSVQRRITVMFLVIIIAYVLSYIPPLAILILSYAIEDFNFITLSESETVAWLYLARFVFLNHIVNPFIYGYFDTKFRDQLQICFKKCKRKTFLIK